MRQWKVVCMLAVGLCSGMAQAEELADKIEIDWSNLRVRYKGYAELQGEQELANWSELVDAAVQSGLTSFVSKFPGIRAQRYQRDANEEDQRLAHKIASTTYVSSIEYSAENQVAVSLESSLSRALGAQMQGFKKQLPDPALTGTNSAIVLRVRGSVQPTGNYVVVDRLNGEVLYQYTDVPQSVYEQGLMGRWFENAEQKSFAKFAGGDPVYIEAQMLSPGEIAVNSDDWKRQREVNPALLEGAKIALLVSE